MPGRNDFAIIRAALLTDARAHSAATAYIEAGLAVEPTALATVVGHVAMLGVWATRDTDDGVLPGDGVIAASAALMTHGDTTRRIIAALETAQLLRRQRRGVYIVGFRDCYSALWNKRKADRERAAEDRKAKALEEKRRRADVAATSALRRSDVAPESQRTGAVAAAVAVAEAVQNPPVPNARDATAGVSASTPSANGHGNHRPLPDSERAGVLAACSAILGKRDIDRDIRAKTKAIQAALMSLDATATDPDEIAEFVRVVVYARTEARIAYLGARRTA